MYLEYLRKRGYFYWDELGCFAKAFGFPSDVFYCNIPEEYTGSEPGLTFETLLDMMEGYRYFGEALDRSCNIHTDQWNIMTMKKALPLIDRRIFSFEELRSIRVAYQVYEANDTKGMRIDATTLLRTLKMCKRVISPLKMMNRIKHMRSRLDEPDRIQLYEFFDLLLWAEDYEAPEVEPGDAETTRNDRDLYQIVDFRELMKHHDQKVEAQLDAEYIQQERRFTKERHSSQRMPRDAPPVNAEIRKQQVHRHKAKYRQLRGEVGDAQDRVYRAKAGYVRERPISAPECLQLYKTGSATQTRSGPSSSMSREQQERPLTVMEIAGHLIRPLTPATPMSDVREQVPRPHVEMYERPPTPRAVTPSDVTNTKHTIDALHFQMETIEMKYQQMLHEDLEYHVPNYREKLLNRPKSECRRDDKKRMRRQNIGPDLEYLRNMAYAHSGKKHPSPAHARACDARFRGWGDVSTRRGPHYVLTAQSFDEHPTRRLVQKLYNSTVEMSGQEDYTYRYTHPHQVQSTPRQHRSMKSQRKMKSRKQTEKPEESVRPPEDAGETRDEKTERKKEAVTSLGSSEEIDWEDFSVYQDGKKPEFMKEINNPRAATQRRASQGSLRRRSSLEVTMTTPTKSRASSKSRRKSRDDVNDVTLRKLAGKSRRVENEEIGEEDSNAKHLNMYSLESGAIKRSSQKNHGSIIDVKMSNLGKVSVMEQISEFENEKQHGENEEDPSDHDLIESKAANRSAQINHGSITDREPRVNDTDQSDDILAQITARIDELAKKAPDWLTDILTGNMPPVSPTNKRPAYKRLAYRAGGGVSGDLKARLLSSVG